MFTNIGKKIKALAKIVCWLGIICSVIAGLCICFTKTEVFNTAAMVIFGILTMIGGGLASWIGSFMMYAFGDLVDNSQAIRAKLENK